MIAWQAARQRRKHAVELVTFDGYQVVRPGDDEGRLVLVDFGVVSVIQDLDGAELTVHERGEEVFAIDGEGPIEGRCRWGYRMPALAGLVRLLEDRFGRQPDHREHLH
jgi:hypothetical protein